MVHVSWSLSNREWINENGKSGSVVVEGLGGQSLHTIWTNNIKNTIFNDSARKSTFASACCPCISSRLRKGHTVQLWCCWNVLIMQKCQSNQSRLWSRSYQIRSSCRRGNLDTLLTEPVRILELWKMIASRWYAGTNGTRSRNSFCDVLISLMCGTNQRQKCPAENWKRSSLVSSCSAPVPNWHIQYQPFVIEVNGCFVVLLQTWNTKAYEHIKKQMDWWEWTLAHLTMCSVDFHRYIDTNLAGLKFQTISKPVSLS